MIIVSNTDIGIEESVLNFSETHVRRRPRRAGVGPTRRGRLSSQCMIPDQLVGLLYSDQRYLRSWNRVNHR